MQTHRIPQHVTGYQGRILGRLTAKQFLLLAAGGIVIFTMLATLPITITTIVLDSLIALFTLAFALAEVDDRSLDQWLFNFILALQSTPQYIWHKEEIIPEILIPGHRPSIQQDARRTKDTKSKEKLDKFLQFWHTEAESDLTEYEQRFLERLKEIQQPTTNAETFSNHTFRQQQANSTPEEASSKPAPASRVLNDEQRK